MAISSFYHNIVITDDETAERFVAAIKATKCESEKKPRKTCELLQEKEEIRKTVERMVKANVKAGPTQKDAGARFGPLNRVENLFVAAEHSTGCARQWLRYLGKEFNGKNLKLTDEQLKTLLASEQLSVLQKVILKRAVDEGTATNAYVIALNSRAKTPMVDKLIRKKEQGRQNTADTLKTDAPVSFTKVLEDFGPQTDGSLLLEAFGEVYGMNWLEAYFTEHEEEILEKL